MYLTSFLKRGCPSLSGAKGKVCASIQLIEFTNKNDLPQKQEQKFYFRLFSVVGSDDLLNGLTQPGDGLIDSL
jgi:hypothetical protein